MADLLRSVAAIVLAAPLSAAPAADAVGVVARFNAGLVEAMRRGKALGSGGRYALLLPLVKATHDLPAMTRLVVGPRWAAMPAADRAALVAAFTRHSTTAYASNFVSFDGERFDVAPPAVRGADVLVRSSIVARGGTTVLGYRLRQGEGGWRIVDVLAEGVSQIAVQRAEFAATLAAGGAAALVAKLTAADDAKLRR